MLDTAQKNAPRLAALFRPRRYALERLNAFWMEKVSGDAKRHRQVCWPDEQPINAVDCCNLVHNFHGFRSFNLDRNPSIAIRRGHMLRQPDPAIFGFDVAGERS